MKIINDKFLEDVSGGKDIKLNLGAGLNRVDGYYNVDHTSLPGIDIVADLNLPLTEIPNESINAIYARHVMEHVHSFLPLMSEIYRICRPGAEVKIIVPHFSNPYYYSDPTHVRQFGLYSMHYLMDDIDQVGRKLPSYYTQARFQLRRIKYDFHRTTLLDKIIVPIIRPLVNLSLRTQDIYERRFAWLYPAYEIRFNLLVKK